jgi:hypothetical protein
METRQLEDDTGAERLHRVASSRRTPVRARACDSLAERLRQHRASSTPAARRGFAVCTQRSPNGEVPEWPNGPDCKSGGYAFGGSNPPLPTSNARVRTPRAHGMGPVLGSPAGCFRSSSLSVGPGSRARAAPARAPLRGRSSMVELQPSKLITWVRFPSPAPNSHPTSSRSPALTGRSRPDCCCSSVVEHFLGKEEVMGSSPISSSSAPSSTNIPITTNQRNSENSRPRPAGRRLA